MDYAAAVLGQLRIVWVGVAPSISASKSNYLSGNFEDTAES